MFKNLIKPVLAVSIILFFCSSAFSYSKVNDETDSVLQYTLDNAASDYERAIILEVFKRRFPTTSEADLALVLNRGESDKLEKYKSNSCGTPLNLEFSRIISLYSDYWIDKVRIQLASKPADLTKKKTNADFEVWYTDAAASPNKTTSAYADKVLDFMAKSKKTEIDDWGYKKGGSEDTTIAGTQQAAKYQVHIHALGGAFGNTTDFLVNPAGAAATPQTFTTIGVDPAVADNSLLLDTCAHEYHHASELAYMDFAGFKLWILEASTTWIARQVRLQYSAVTGTGSWNLFKNRVEYHQNNPDRSLDLTGSTVRDNYDAGLFLWFLADSTTSGASRDLILNFWKKMGDLNDWTKIFVAFDSALSGLGSSLNSFDKIFPFFASANYSVKNKYPKVIKTAKIANGSSPHKLDYSSATSHEIDWQAPKVNHIAKKYYKFVPGPSLKKPAMLSLKINGADNKAVKAIAIAKKKDGSFIEYPFTLDATTKEGEVGIPGFSSETMEEVVVTLVNCEKTENNIEIKYKGSLKKAFTFVIDDTGSMGGEIDAAKTAANKVLDDNKAAGIERFYTLISFKDGPGTIDGQSSDEDVMKGFVNALGASGGSGCPESALLSIRQATELADGGDIMMMTDATSNSFGVDYTYATWGEVALTIFKLLETNSRLSTIVFTSGCISYDLAPDGDEFSQCPGCYPETDVIAAADSSGREGYARISSESGGLYFDATTIDSEAITEIILRTSTTDSTISTREGDGAGTFAIPVDSSVSQFQIILNADPGSSLTLAVKNPGGVTVEDSTDGVTVSTVVGSTHYIIGDAALASGNWTAIVSGTGTYRISAEASTTNLMTYTGDTSVGLGGTLNMEASLREAVSGVVFGLLRSDGTILAAVPVTTTDGLNFTATRVMNTVGSFLFGVIGDGSFMRMSPTKITVGSLAVIAPPVKFATPGSSFTHTFQFKNLGTESDTYDLTATSSEGWAVVPDEGVPVTVAAGGTLSFDITVNVPADATTGQIDRLSIQAVSQTDPFINSTDETETRVTTQPSPAITVSDSDPDSEGPVRTSTSAMTGTVSLSAGTGLGENADWWVVADTPLGWFYFDLLTRWTFVVDPAAGLPTTHQGPLFDLAPFEILSFSVAGLPSGPYTFYFAVDTNMNGVIDFGELFFDSAEILVP